MSRSDEDNTAPEDLEIYVPDPLEVDGQLISHNVHVDGHRTSVRLEAVMWVTLHEIAQRESMSLNQLITLISRRKHKTATLTATIRAFIVAYLRAVGMLRLRRRLLDRDTKRARNSSSDGQYDA